MRHWKPALGRGAVKFRPAHLDHKPLSLLHTDIQQLGLVQYLLQGQVVRVAILVACLCGGAGGGVRRASWGVRATFRHICRPGQQRSQCDLAIRLEVQGSTAQSTTDTQMGPGLSLTFM